MTYRRRLVAQFEQQRARLRARRSCPTSSTDEAITHATARRVPADPAPQTGGIAPRAIAMLTGHHRLADGSVVRVDYELGRWVGTLYAPGMRVKTRIVGSHGDVHTWADKIAA